MEKRPVRPAEKECVSMNIRQADAEDLNLIMEIYSYAKKYMAETGNPTQWGEGYPSRDLLQEDILKNQCYVYEDGEEIQAVFVLALGEEPTYRRIEDGAWKNNAPYGTIHRLASRGKLKGVSKACIDFCKARIGNLRSDTHHDNKIMQHLLEKNGFERCGIIYLEDGSPRIAYQCAG
jgi:hypothetical protein